MIPNSRDIYDYRHMYKKFLEDAEEDYNEKMDDIRRYDNLLYKIKFDLESRREDIQSMFGICLYDYWQWNTDEYDESDKMFNTLIAINSSIDVVNVEAKLLFQKFSRYFRILSKLHSLKSQCRRIKARKLISKDRFRDVLSRYYKQVSIEILEGRIYKFSNAIGYLLVERLHFNEKEITNPFGTKFKWKEFKIPDWKETMKNKQKILDAGLIPFKQEDADKAAENHVKYEGVPYMVYKEMPYCSRVVLIDRRFPNSSYTRFEMAMKERQLSKEAIFAKYQPKNPHEIIHNLRDESLRTRLYLLTTHYLDYTRKYIRNELQIPITSRSYRGPLG